ncbi:PhzF family phenazine biosynthesis protein [Paucibacter sp. Y2R2-4]|uniref:PhzF family phenazine biosynthesis protein n=1 Tax=Paucibacter sp. Y2R2-4 TaxID=2893553 RepID=UPI0021E3DFB5|nr:PhzF family phenazine biosynthesis protein [Paucibacter sp. Y2R2-4]MCV2350855.1 PhzF family phenazine biosynthesis protein [Paucibacter sp. Y2R2-4]
MQSRRFAQVDVFSAVPLMGNPLAVVIDAEGLSDAAMASFARWTNLSETTFLLPPTDPDADYRLRIFTPGGELPFAGHPTLGSAHSWLAAGGTPKRKGELRQQCGIGLVRIKRVVERSGKQRLAFAAPPLRRGGPVSPDLHAQVLKALRQPTEEVLDVVWVDNGPPWIAARLQSAEAVLALKPDFMAMAGLELGVIGAYPAGAKQQFEVRVFVPTMGFPEDPVTGSFNAGVALWMMERGLCADSYVAAQGKALGRAGRIQVQREGADVWIGGDVTTLIEGEVRL